MIDSADEFVRLRSSAAPGEYWRAAHDDAPIAVWLDVIDRFPDYREWVVHNKLVPLEILVILAADPDPGVRLMVAMKNKLTEDLLNELARDRDPMVRNRVAHHKRASVQVLAVLAEDSEEYIRSRARQRLATLGHSPTAAGQDWIA